MRGDIRFAAASLAIGTSSARLTWRLLLRYLVASLSALFKKSLERLITLLIAKCPQVDAHAALPVALAFLFVA